MRPRALRVASPHHTELEVRLDFLGIDNRREGGSPGPSKIHVEAIVKNKSDKPITVLRLDSLLDPLRGPPWCIAAKEPSDRSACRSAAG